MRGQNGLLRVQAVPGRIKQYWVGPGNDLFRHFFAALELEVVGAEERG